MSDPRYLLRQDDPHRSEHAKRAESPSRLMAKSRNSSVGQWPRRALRLLRDSGRALRTILGVPDYEAYVERLSAIHPEAIPITQAEFARQQLEARFNRPGSRCC